MKTTTLIVLSCIMLGAFTGAEVCYPPYDCFPDGPPWCETLQRPLCADPWSPETIDPRYFLLTRENPINYQVIRILDISSISGTNFKATRKSIFIVHGYGEKGDKQWLIETCQNFLTVSDVNCFCVDWRNGSIGLYTQAANNVRLVGAMMAYSLRYLNEQFSYPMSYVYLVGHSLGAQVLGEVGKRQPGIGRMTALDAAGPLFEGTPREVRLDSSDARLVDAIHTNGAPGSLMFGFGMKEAFGHIDFFPNGGELMPGCDQIPPISLSIDEIFQGVYLTIFCHHQMSFRYFAESILRPEGFMSYPAPSYPDFQKGAGFPCSSDSCAFMGYRASDYIADGEVPTSGRMFFLNTGDPSNFPRWRFQVTSDVQMSMSVMVTFGVSLCSKETCTRHLPVHSGLVSSSGSYKAMVDAEVEVNPVERVVFSWNTVDPPLVEPTMRASSVTVQYGPTGEMFYFCGTDQVTQGTTQTLQPCTTTPTV